MYPICGRTKKGNTIWSSLLVTGAYKTQLLSKYSRNLVTQIISFVGEELVDFPDFLALVAKSVQDTDSHDELREAFKAFDRNGDDIIDAAELRLIMSKLGEQLTDAEIDEMIQTADRDGDGQVHYEGIYNNKN